MCFLGPVLLLTSYMSSWNSFRFSILKIEGFRLITVIVSFYNSVLLNKSNLIKLLFTYNGYFFSFCVLLTL